MKTEHIVVTWEVDDGYVRGSAPRRTDISVQEIQDCETLEAAVELVEQAIEDDFRTHANPCWDSERLRKQVEKVWNKRET